jgi:hypothetical protein
VRFKGYTGTDCCARFGKRVLKLVRMQFRRFPLDIVLLTATTLIHAIRPFMLIARSETVPGMPWNVFST